MKSSKKTDFSNVIEWIENYIDSEQFEGVAAGIFNANIISRKLGLQDKSQTEVTTNQLPPLVMGTATTKSMKAKEQKDRKF